MWRHCPFDPGEPTFPMLIGSSGSAKTGLMHRSKQHLYLITSSARPSSVSGKHRFYCVICSQTICSSWAGTI